MAMELPNKENMAHLTIRINEFHKKATAYYSYTTLSLIAEVGGYVGLFLGYAIIQVSEVFDYFVYQGIFYFKTKQFTIFEVVLIISVN